MRSTLRGMGRTPLRQRVTSGREAARRGAAALSSRPRVCIHAENSAAVTGGGCRSSPKRLRVDRR